MGELWTPRILTLVFLIFDLKTWRCARADSQAIPRLDGFAREGGGTAMLGIM
jgi:hypothetical protein